MARRYVEVESARFSVRRVDGVEEVATPARRSWFLLLFLGFWLALWTIAGVVALYQVAQEFDLFLVFWLGGWALGWLFAASVVAWQINGREILRVIGGDLQVEHSAVGLKKSWWFRGDEVRDLQASDQPVFPFGWGMFDAPFMFWRRWGAVRFRYGARTVYLGPALDSAEGQLIVDVLQKHLPRAVTEA